MKKIFIVLMLTLMSINVVSAAQQEQKASSKPKTEKVVDPSNDQNPVVGEIKMSNGQTYQVHRGPRGGLYIWWKYTKGAKQGQVGKRNLNKSEKEKVIYTKK